MTRHRGPMTRRTCPCCQLPTTVTSTDKIGKHRDGSGETCQAHGLHFRSAQVIARLKAIEVRLAPLREQLEPIELRRIETAIRDRDFRLAETMLGNIEARS